jgi:hypothetical protein
MFTNKSKLKNPQHLDTLWTGAEAKSEFEQTITPSYDKMFHDLNRLFITSKLPNNSKEFSDHQSFDFERELQNRVLSFNHLLRMSGQTKDNCFFINLRDYFHKDIQKGLKASFGNLTTVQKFNNLQSSLKANEYLRSDYPVQKFTFTPSSNLIEFKEVSGVPLAIVDHDISSGKFLKRTSSGVLIRNEIDQNIGMAVVNKVCDSSQINAERLISTIQHEFVHACNTFTINKNQSEEVSPSRTSRLRSFRDEFMAYEMTNNTLGGDIDWVNRAFFYLKQDDPDYKEFSNITKSWMQVMDRSLFKNAKDKRLGFAIRNYLFFHAKKIEDINLNNKDTVKKIIDITGIDISSI